MLCSPMIALRKVVRHYAILKGLEFAKGTKTDPTRFIAKGAADGCPWCINASLIEDKKTVKVNSSQISFVLLFR